MDGSVKVGDSIPRKWKQWFKDDKQHSAEWRKEARNDFDFVAGRQWAQEDKDKLKAEMRPAITFNRTAVMVDAVSGQEIQNKQEIRYLPREQGDVVVNEMYSEAARWFDDESEAADEESDAFTDTVICGMGWTEDRLEFDDDPDGVPACDQVDPLEMYWDAAARKNNLKGSRRAWRVKEMPLDEAKQDFPDIEPNDLDAGGWVETGDESKTNNNDPEDRYDDEAPESGSSSAKKVRIIHLQYWVHETFYRIADPLSGQVTEMDADKFEPMAKNMKRFGIDLKSVKLRRKKYMQAFIGRKVLEHRPGSCKTGFTWNCITGKRDRTKGTWYGLVRAMKDPATWANKWMSQLLHIMNSNAKGGVFYEQGAFVDQRDAEENYANPSKMIEVQNGALAQGKIKERNAAQFPAGYQMLTEHAISAIRDVTGVNLELLGMREANQAGVLEYQRRQAGLTVLSTMFNSLKRYRRARGRVLLHFITEHLSDGRLIRITGKDTEQYVPLVKQANVKFDIIVDEAPTSPNQKELVWQTVSTLLPGIKDIVPQQVLLELLEYSPLPASVVQKIKEVVKAPDPKAEEKARMEAQAMLTDLQQKQAILDKTKSETRENEAEAALDHARLGVDAQKLEIDGMKTQLDAAKVLLEASEPIGPAAPQQRLY